MSRARPQRGAALLLAMLVLTLVASLAAAALWQQWRDVEVEGSERTRVQAAWILSGALDWSRLILREDARSGGADHLGEPWATPLAEARLSSFLAQNPNETLDGPEAFLSGRITDAQGRLNLTGLFDGQKMDAPTVRAWVKLGRRLGVEEPELLALAENWRLAADPKLAPADASPMLLPQRVEQLLWLGLSPVSLQRLRPHIIVLPVATPVNFNTASAEVIYASVPGLDMAQASQLVQARTRAPFNTRGEVENALPALTGLWSDTQHAVASRFFLVDGQLRLGDAVLQERSLIQRNGLDTTTLWRERWSDDALSTMANLAP
jgi:general secretion pathway protein K